VPLAEFIDGPHDGLIANKQGLPFLWLDAKGRAFRSPRRGRSLYRAAETREMFSLGTVRLYRHAQHTHAVCGGCGCIHERAPTCSLCGAGLT
jgi:hypothetical protein